MAIRLAFVASLALLAVSAAAQESKKHSQLKAQLTALPNLAAFLQGDEAAAGRFADAAFDSPGMQSQEWRLFDSLLGGGKLDPGGSLIRPEIKKLPPEQWYYLIRLEDHRRSLSELNGGNGLYVNAVEGVGNLVRTEKYELHLLKCHEQGETLMRNMDPVKDTGRPRSLFQPWSSELVTAKFQKLNEHNAPCFHFDGPEGPVEIVADSWAGDLLPARAWWAKWDPESLLRLNGKGVCGKYYEPFDDARIAVQMEKDRTGWKAKLEAAKNRVGALLPPK